MTHLFTQDIDLSIQLNPFGLKPGSMQI